jgi:zinc transport system substrate-binding protein
MAKGFLSLITVLIVLFLLSCSKTMRQENTITVTIEPQRYFVNQLADTLFAVESMVPVGTSPETYDPTPGQMAKLAHSKAYFCIGHIGFEEVWTDKLKANYPQIIFFDNSQGIRFISGQPAEHETKHNSHHHHSHEGLDPHIWNSPKDALLIARNMYEALTEIDAANEPFYAANLSILSKKIQLIDQQVTEILSRSSQKSFIIYHPALTYFARDYGLTQYCIEIDGKEPSPEQLKLLIETAKEKNIRTIFIQQEFDKKNAEAIAKETGCKLVVINPLSYDWETETLHIANALSDE